MKHNIENDQVAFIVASLVALSDMSETELRESLNIIGIETIRELLTMDSSGTSFPIRKWRQKFVRLSDGSLPFMLPVLTPIYWTCLVAKSPLS